MTMVEIATIGLAFVAAAGVIIIAHSGDVSGRDGRLPWRVHLGEALLFGGFMGAVIINLW